jgi:DNA-binding IclR family transcriptional regulator
VEWVEFASPLRIEVRPDTRLPVHCSANGKLLLAYSPRQTRERILAGAPFPAHTRNTMTSASGLAAELETIRRRGYAEDNEEFLDGVICLAVPVRNRRRQVVAGLALMAPAARLSLAKARTYLPDLLRCARLISADLGYRRERRTIEPVLDKPLLE